MHLRIEKCAPTQVNLLTKFVRKTFAEAFEVHNTVENFSSYVNTYLTREQLGRELEHPDSNFYFVHFGDDLVGYFKVNEHGAQTELKKEESMELERIYVDARFQGRNIGSWMLQQVIAMAHREGKSFLWLGVWVYNTAAIRFYERQGFVKFGEHPYYIGTDRQIDWLMRVDLLTLDHP